MGDYQIHLWFYPAVMQDAVSFLDLSILPAYKKNVFADRFIVMRKGKYPVPWAS
jgi:hypothetical protein